MEPGLNNRESFKPLGQKAVAALHAWLCQNRYSLRLDHWLDGGGSGGKVAVVYLEECDGHRDSRRLVLKLCPPGEETEYEPGNNRMAWGDAPQRFSRHLLEPEPTGVIQVADTSWWLMFQRLAKGGTRDIDTLARVPEPRLAATYTAIVRPLLSDWGEWAHVPSMLVSDFLTRQLDKRLGPKGGVRAWAARFRPELLEEPVPWIEIASEKLPNPFALVTGSSFGGSELQNVYVGRAHGDLHPGNILMPVTPSVRAGQFVLVDLARYRTEAPLAQDPAQLLLCLVAQHYLPSSGPQREALLSLLTRSGVSVGTLVPPTASALVKNFWQLSRQRFKQGLVDQWTEQGILSVMACALMFLGRRGIEPADRWWFFRLAAYAAQAYVDLAEATEVNGPVCRVNPPDGGQWEANDAPEPPSTPDEQDSPRDDTRARRARLRMVEPQVSRSADHRAADSGNGANVRRVDFGQRRWAKKAARLTRLLGINVARLTDEVTAIPRTLPPDVAYSRATSARQLAAALASAIGELAALGVGEQFALGAAIQYTQARGRAETALHTAQELMSSLDASASVGDDLRALSTAVGQVSSAVAELDSLVGPYR